MLTTTLLILIGAKTFSDLVAGVNDHRPHIVHFSGSGLLQTVPAVIGTSDTIDNTAAVVFARSFYAAVASAQSIASAVEQAKVQMLSASVLDSD